MWHLLEIGRHGGVVAAEMDVVELDVDDVLDAAGTTGGSQELAAGSRRGNGRVAEGAVASVVETSGTSVTARQSSALILRDTCIGPPEPSDGAWPAGQCTSRRPITVVSCV
jgi:hypothetical protein